MKSRQFFLMHLYALLGVTACLLLLNPIVASAKLIPGDEYQADFEAAVAEYDTRNYAEARIHLKNALKRRPDHLPSRLLLGKTALKLGRAPEAEKELLIALRLGAAKDQVVVPLGNALLVQRKHREILESITLDGISASGRYEVLTLRGRAQYEMGELKAAHLSFNQAIAYNNTLMHAYLGKAKTFSAAGRYAEAEVQLDLALERNPAAAELLYEKAGIRRRLGDATGAMELYNEALVAYPDHMRARLGRASLNLRLGNPAEAREDAQYVHTSVPLDPDAALIYAQALGRSGELEKAQNVLQRAGDNLSRISDERIFEQSGLLRIAALISLQQGATERANTYLDQYLLLVPYELRMRKIAARVKVQLGDGDGAARVLYPYYRKNTKDAELLNLLGEAYLESGRFGEAQVVLEQAVDLQPAFPEVNTLLALSKIGTGDSEDTWQDLATANSASRGSAITAGIILAMMQSRSGNYDDALTISKGLLERQPRNPILHNLVGIVMLGRNDLNQARVSFEEALAADPSFVPAMYNMGLLEQKTNNLDTAELWFNRILEVKPGQPTALSALAEIAVIRGDYSRAVSLLEKATISEEQSKLPPHLRLIEIHLILGDILAAQSVTSAAQRRFPKNAKAAEIAGRVEMAAGSHQKAINRFRRASLYASLDGPMLILIADQQITLEDYEGALATLTKATVTEEKSVAYERLVALHTRQGETEKARSVVLQVQNEEPEAALGHLLEGTILRTEGKYEDAISQYHMAFEKQETRDTLLELYELYFFLGRPEEGFELLEKWLEDHPDDTITQRNLALGYLKLNRVNEARTMLENLVKTRPRDSLVLVSLAQLYQQDGNPEARLLAERALRVAPNWGIALDTYGWVLVNDDEAEAGLKYLREAVTRDSNPLIRFHLATALYRLDRKSEALTELEAILQLSTRPPWIGSAEELYDTIKQPG